MRGVRAAAAQKGGRKCECNHNSKDSHGPRLFAHPSGRSKSVGGNRLARAEIDGVRGRDGLLREIDLVGRTVDHETIRQESSNVNPQSHFCIVPKAGDRHAAPRGAVVWVLLINGDVDAAAVAGAALPSRHQSTLSNGPQMAPQGAMKARHRGSKRRSSASGT